MSIIRHKPLGICLILCVEIIHITIEVYCTDRIQIMRFSYFKKES